MCVFCDVPARAALLAGGAARVPCDARDWLAARARCGATLPAPMRFGAGEKLREPRFAQQEGRTWAHPTEVRACAGMPPATVVRRGGRADVVRHALSASRARSGSLCQAAWRSRLALACERCAASVVWALCTNDVLC